ncbi:PREDICTED: uncharacterized protein LOC106122625 [Papilio xuthus]|uniref:Uncharacterized protein LOC106122625 n=1 Tax=Papilio xuthus TaxID=66420 RepID=A0AAJ6ZKC8_PAPXU|nr:PREDICTED: uncharacterized protein LOC106122625 [Papilio xuthus]
MSDLNSRIPDVATCCICIPDLKSAVIIIAVLGIVTCPAVTWALIRHTYLIRMSCIMTTCSQKPDVIDINFHYVLSFGLSPNAGLERSFFNMNTTYLRDWKNGALSDNSKKVFDPGLVEALKYFGFVVFLFDVIFLITCIIFLIRIFRRVNKKTVKWFLYTAIATTVLAFMYGIFYVFVCVSIGTGFPILEFLFTLIDLVVWTYFIIVIKSFRKAQGN